MYILARIIKETKELERKSLKIVRKEVDTIIKENIKDVDRIEYTLDVLSSFSFVDSSYEFNRLNKYYESINKENSQEYKLIYKEHKYSDE